MKGGIKAWNGLKAVGPEEMGIEALSGEESTGEVIQLAYGMEEGLRTFYAVLAEKKDALNLSELLSELSRVEEKHKERLYQIYLRTEPAPKGRLDFESDIDSNAMEGGFTTEEFLEQNKKVLNTVPDILNLAMMLETQALDLYMRYSQKMTDEKKETVFQELAEDEKKHLAMLGRMMDENMRKKKGDAHGRS